MQFSTTTLLFGFVAIASAASVGVSRDVIDARQAANGACCIPNQSLKQDACTVDGTAGKCVPGGPAQCGGALNCVTNNQLTCDNSVSERSGVLCRFQLPNGKLQDGAEQIDNLSQATVN